MTLGPWVPAVPSMRPSQVTHRALPRAYSRTLPRSQHRTLPRAHGRTLPKEHSRSLPKSQHRTYRSCPLERHPGNLVARAQSKFDQVFALYFDVMRTVIFASH